MRFTAWYLFAAPLRIARGAGNILAFNLRYFSLPLLLRTLASPWRRISWSYEQDAGFRFSKVFEVLFSNFISRLLGAFVRLGTILLAFATEAFLLAASLFALLGWFILLPLCIIGISYGIRLLI